MHFLQYDDRKQPVDRAGGTRGARGVPGGLSGGHYSRFGVFLFKIGMHVKTVQIEFFAIEIIISIHILSLKKVLPKCEI